RPSLAPIGRAIRRSGMLRADNVRLSHTACTRSRTGSNTTSPQRQPDPSAMGSASATSKEPNPNARRTCSGGGPWLTPRTVPHIDALAGLLAVFAAHIAVSAAHIAVSAGCAVTPQPRGPTHNPRDTTRYRLGTSTQYVGKLGSTCLAQASTPPPRWVASRKPALCSAANASADRAPDLQCNTIGLSCGNSARASPERMRSFGISLAPLMLTIS